MRFTLFRRAKALCAKSRRSQRVSASDGYSLLEIMIVISIIGILVTLVAPQLFGRLDQSKVTAAQAQVRMLRSALDSYRLDVGAFPSREEGLSALIASPPDRTGWRGPYLEAGKVPVDPWGHDYVYAPAENGDVPAIYSLGSDGQPGGSGLATDVGLLPIAQAANVP